jgi:transposase
MANKQAHWQAHLDAWRASGLSQSMYCKKHGLSLSRFPVVDGSRAHCRDEAVVRCVPGSPAAQWMVGKASNGYGKPLRSATAARTGDMLSPTGWWLVTEPLDLRSGIDRLLVYVRQTLGDAPFGGTAYVFRNRSASRIKVLHADAQGYGWRCDGCRKAISYGLARTKRCGH